MEDRGWLCPHPPPAEPRLVLTNSLVDRKEPLVPQAGAASKKLTWYTCGPTVYDSAHVGHARNYLTFDVVRRVLEDYFGYNIQFVMNVTDVDDKIVFRARRNHLLDDYLREVRASCPSGEGLEGEAARLRLREDGAAALSEAAAEVDEELARATAALDAARAAGAAARQLKALEEAVDGAEHLRQEAEKSRAEFEALAARPDASGETLVKVASDALGAWLDRARGAEVRDLGIFRAHAARFEAEFFADMDELGVRRPSVLTRVSDYMPEIVDYVAQIERAGMAYTLADGSVYFDTAAFAEHGHTYGRLAPYAVGAGAGDAAAAVEERGDAADAGGRRTSKKRGADFALWKASKPGEPFWPSPWGEGRPGWHIECSAMASAIVGGPIDIHSGGEDLRFPHHENEIAQAEAYYHQSCGCNFQWVNYFLHSGHLDIKGRKMSKSLKNFKTIKEELQDISARQMRLLFVLQNWERRISYSDSAKEELRARESHVVNFLANMHAALRSVSGDASAPLRWGEAEQALQRALDEAHDKVHERLLDSIDTRGAMDAISTLIRSAHSYLDQRRAPQSPRALLLERVRDFVLRILTVFGLAFPLDGSDSLAGAGAGEAEAKDREARAVDVLSEFRDGVRRAAREIPGAGKVLVACDAVRDGPLVDLGIQLEDRGGDSPAVWKRGDPVALRKAQRDKAAAALEVRREKLVKAQQSKQRELEKVQHLRTLPAVEELYELGADGRPVFDRVKQSAIEEGKPRDKAMKDLEKQIKIRSPLDKFKDDPSFEALMKDISELQMQADGLGSELGG